MTADEIETVPVHEYRRLRNEGYAGSLDSLAWWARPRWPASHWLLEPTADGLKLLPINVDAT